MRMTARSTQAESGSVSYTLPAGEPGSLLPHAARRLYSNLACATAISNGPGGSAEPVQYCPKVQWASLASATMLAFFGERGGQ